MRCLPYLSIPCPAVVSVQYLISRAPHGKDYEPVPRYGMEVKGYIIPPPMETEQCIKILRPDKKHDQPRRCGGKTSPEDLKQAQRLILDLMSHTDDLGTMQRIILLRVCRNTHRKTLERSEILGVLIHAYKKTYVGPENPMLSIAARNEDLFELFHSTGRGNTVSDILPKVINQRQAAQGSVYIFNWPRQTRFLKIGYAKRSAEDRVDEWQLCHPEAICLYEAKLAFPERMEKLIHAELACKRYRLRERCSRCGKKHTEWFAVTFEEAQQTIRDWHEIAASPLYTEDGGLSRRWSRIVGSLSQATASTLSQHLKKSPFSDMSSISEQPEASSRGTSTHKSTTLATSLHDQEDSQIEELTTILDRDLTISQEHDKQTQIRRA